MKKKKDYKKLLEQLLEQRTIDDGECLIWQSALCGSGFPCCKVDGRYVSVRRWIYEQIKGSIPNKMYVVTTCRDKKCVNPDHMQIMSQSEYKLMIGYSSVRRNAGIAAAMRKKSRISQDDVEIIRTSALSAKEIAAQYKISSRYVYQIRSYQKRVDYRDVWAGLR